MSCPLAHKKTNLGLLGKPKSDENEFSNAEEDELLRDPDADMSSESKVSTSSSLVVCVLNIKCLGYCHFQED